MRHVGGKEAAIARLQLHRFSPDFGARAAFQHVADLLDTGMRMRERALAFLYDTQHHFELLGPYRLRADQSAIYRTGMIGGRIGLHVMRLHEVPAGAHVSSDFAVWKL